MVQERLPLLEMTLRQLRRIASEYGISRYSRLRKSQLIDAIERVQQERRARNAPVFAPSAEAQDKIAASKFGLGSAASVEAMLSSVDDGLPELPDGYSDPRIVLMPRDPHWCYAYWDISTAQREQRRRQGGQQLALRLYDVTFIDLDRQDPHSVQEYPCDETAREWYLPVPVSDRDYVVEIGYRCADGRWLMLARSASVRVPPVYPSDWIEDRFATVEWHRALAEQEIEELTPPEHRRWRQASDRSIYDRLFALAAAGEAQHLAGSLYGSMQMSASYVLPASAGVWATGDVPKIAIAQVRGGETVAGEEPFWLVADAELVVYGSTEPEATLLVDGQQVPIAPDGTFRFQMSFRDGELDYPLVAVSPNGDRSCMVHMHFSRQTPSESAELA